MNTRTKILNWLAEEIGAQSYLEIGVRNPRDNFDHIQVNGKDGIDPNSTIEATQKMTSDEFFKLSNVKYDLIFIDGDHTYEQAKQDLLNSLNHLTRGGLIVMHDAMPRTPRQGEAIKEAGRGYAWCGEVWKVCQYALARGDTQVALIPYDYGLAVISRGYEQGKVDTGDVDKLKADEWMPKCKLLSKKQYKELRQGE